MENTRNWNFHLKKLEKEEQTKLKASKSKEILKMTVEINEIEYGKTTENISEPKS